MISLKQLRSMVPMPATDGSGDTWLKLETGNTFGRIYEFVDTLNGTSGERLVAVGGSDGGVGIGGWTLGGGHSALSRMFGKCQLLAPPYLRCRCLAPSRSGCRVWVPGSGRRAL